MRRVEDAVEGRSGGIGRRRPRIEHGRDRLPNPTDTGRTLRDPHRPGEIRGPADRRGEDIVGLRIEPAHPQLADRVAVQFGDLDLEQHLARARDMDPVDDERAGAGESAAEATTPRTSTSTAPAHATT